jgi:hypothetical protein
LKAAAGSKSSDDLFMNSASPGVVAMFIPSRHHGTEDAYIADLANALKQEYEIIYKAGILLQIDCPDLALSWHIRHWQKTDKEFLAIVERNLEAINHATSGIPSEAMRIHICWGNYAGPHTHDYPIAKLFHILAKARAQAIVFEGANPRHDHEWEDWHHAKLPSDKVLVPGVIDSTNNFVEHPRLVAQRITRMNIINTTAAGTAELLALRNGDLDGLVMFSPVPDRAVVEGYAYYPPCCDIGSTKDFGAFNQVLGANTEFLKDRGLAVKFLKAFFEAQEFFQNNSEKAIDVMSQFSGVSKEIIGEARKHATLEVRIDIQTAMNVARQGPKFGLTKADQSGGVPAYFDLSYLSEVSGKTVGELSKFQR